MVNAKEFKVVSHLIDAEVELAGGVTVRELIITEGKTDMFHRKLNYYSFKDSAWDGKEIDLDNGTIYNGSGIANVKVSAFPLTSEIDLNDLDKDLKTYFSAFNIKEPSSNTYQATDNKDGTYDVYIYDGSNEENVAYYIEYSITNVVVKHNDVKELNYTFKNLNYDADSTLIRAILPFATSDTDNFNIYFHGNQSGTYQEIKNDDGSIWGGAVTFTEMKSEANIRMIIPQEAVSVDIFLNKSELDAKEEIRKLEDAKMTKTKTNNKVIDYVKWFLIGISVIYLLIMYFVLKLKLKVLDIVYILFGLFIALFNFLFNFNLWYLYLVLILPLAFIILRKYIFK